jgi:hypothetical protein
MDRGRVVLDEGHTIGNRKTAFKAASYLQASTRIAVAGTKSGSFPSSSMLLPAVLLLIIISALQTNLWAV